MSYLNWIPFLFFLQILHTECASVKTLGDSVLLPTLAPNPELTRARNYVDKLMVNLLTGYDKKKSSHKPLIIYTYMVIDHLREFVSFLRGFCWNVFLITNFRKANLIF